MPAARAAASREPPSSTSASASIRRAAAASRHRAASRRSPSEPSSCRVIAIVIRALPWVGVQSQTNRVTRNEAPSVTTRQEFGPLVSHAGGATLGDDAWVIDHKAAGVCPGRDPWCPYE
jgi:hypothetical protein